MANIIHLDSDKDKFISDLQKGIQSANLNFLIGSGCSSPAINILGEIEKEIQSLLNQDKAKEADIKTFEFLKPFIRSTNMLIGNSELDENHKHTIENYRTFIEIIAKLLFERKSNILHKQATIFTTNYDLFIEKVSENLTSQINISDGFHRSSSLNNSPRFSTSNFFNILFSIGNLYNYQVEIPSINLIKLHGSLNWEAEDNEIINRFDFLLRAKQLEDTSEEDKIAEFNNLFSLVLPKKDKFKETLLNRVFYDMLRIYANELDKENTLLIANGFSFNDEHIFDITKRALKNPTLKLIIFCHAINPSRYKKKFNENKNVDIVYSNSSNTDFDKFNELLSQVLTKEDSSIQKVKIVNTEDNEK